MHCFALIILILHCSKQSPSTLRLSPIYQNNNFPRCVSSRLVPPSCYSLALPLAHAHTHCTHLVSSRCLSYYSYTLLIIRFALSLTHTLTQQPVLTVKGILTSKFCCCVFKDICFSFLHFETI